MSSGQPETQRAAQSPILRDGTTIYQLNDNGVNRWCAQVQGAHTPRAELEAIAQRFVTALNSHDDLVNALRAASSELFWCANQLAALGYTGREGDSVSRTLAAAKATLAKVGS